MVDELLLQRVQCFTGRDAFDRGNLLTFGLNPEDKAGTDQPPIQGDRAGTAVTCAAAFLGTGEVQTVTQHIQQGFARIAEIVDRITIDGG